MAEIQQVQVVGELILDTLWFDGCEKAIERARVDVGNGRRFIFENIWFEGIRDLKQFSFIPGSGGLTKAPSLHAAEAVITAYNARPDKN